MDGKFLETFAGVVEGQQCAVSTCSSRPVARRNGRALCGKHRDRHDHHTMGLPCERCESRHWTATPGAESVAVCQHCDRVTYDEAVIEHSWRPPDDE